eukprot:jgi/Ulvmu1/8771/UM048_0026.1
MGCLSCLFSKADLTEPLPKAESSPTRTESTRAKYDAGLQFSPQEASKYGEQQLQNAETPKKPQEELLAAPGPQRSRAGSRTGTQMSSAHELPSDDDSHLRVSGNAINNTNTHCSSIDERIEPRKERLEKEREKERSEKVKDKEKDKEREKDKEKDRDREDRKGSGATLSLPVAGEEWRRWKDNAACQDYVILHTLGRGAFADVVLGRHKQTNKHHALKVVYLNKPGLKEKHVAVLQREGTYLRKLQHKNIVRCLKVYQSSHQWVFVLEHLKGGMLLNDLAKLKRYSEKTAAAVFRQVLSAVAYLHENNIVHRDIKPENVVFKTSVSNSAAFGKDNIVKLVDFGMILDLSKEPHSRGMMGSPGFVAPEVILGQHHTSQMDCYSVGVLLFVMLVGAKPMTQDQARSMQYALMTPESLRGMHDPRWRALTEPAKDLILKLLQPDPKNRFTAKQALNHRWIKGAREDSILDGSVMEGWADHLQMLHPGYMGSPSPFGGGGFGASPHLNMRGNTAVSPHHANFRGASYRPNSGLQPQGSSKRGHSGGGGGGGHSGTVGGTPVSPLGVQIGASGAFPPNPLSGPAELSRGHAGTPPADASGLSNPFSWNAEGGHSAPLSQLQFADAAHKAVHDEVMKRAQEKFAQAQQYYMTAQIMRQADNSGLLQGAPGAPLSTPQAGAATGGAGAAPTGTAPQSPSKPVSGLLQTDGSDATQCTTRHDYSLSAVAQSYMSTQNTSGTHGSSAGAGPTGVRNGKASADFDATLKDARNLMHELNKAPSLQQHRSESLSGAGLPRVTKDADKAHSSSYRRSKSGTTGASGHVPRSPHRSNSGRRSGTSGSHSRPVAPPHAQAQAVASTASSARRSSRRSGQGQPIDSIAAAAGVPPAPPTQQRPRSILETPIQDPARDAYYGAGEAEDQTLTSPSARGLRKANRRPSSQRLTSANRTYSGPRPRSKGSKAIVAPPGNGSVDRAAVTVE